MSWITGIPSLCLYLLSRRAHFPGSGERRWILSRGATRRRLVEVHRIISGDPSCGTMAFEIELTPEEGTLVQVSSQLSASTS